MNKNDFQEFSTDAYSGFDVEIELHEANHVRQLQKLITNNSGRKCQRALIKSLGEQRV